MAHHEIKTPKMFEVPSAFQKAMAALVLVGIATFVGMLVTDAHVAWNGYLMGFWFTLSLALAGPFLNATQWLVAAGWSVSIRRIGESMGTFLPYTIVLFIGLYFGGSTLYHWWDPAYVAADPILAKKAPVLTSVVFAAVGITALAAIAGTNWKVRQLSIAQDATDNSEGYLTQKGISAIYLVVFVVGFSFLSWYCLMSLDPHWFSTMWSVYAFAAMFQSGLALMVLILIYLIKNDYFGDFVGEQQVHYLGQLFFGFTVFYAYIGFSQFLLIWYANIPEEAIWFVTRGTPTDVDTGWDWFSVGLPFVKFIIPFLILLPQEHKKNKRNILVYVASWILLMQMLEVWFWVSPTPHVAGELAAHVTLPWAEMLIMGGFIGGFGLVVSKSLAKASLVPVKDPFVHESINHHHHGVRPPEPKEIKIS